MILVTGAAGKTGKAVLLALAAIGRETRAFLHKKGQSAEIKSREHVVGDLTDAIALEAACQGVTSIYHICPNVHPQELLIGKALINAALQAGVDRLVYHSVLYPQIEAMPHHWSKLKVEELIINSGVDFTILQPASYMQNVPPASFIEKGVIRVPYPVDVPFSPVDLLDVAEVAALVLSSPDHSRTTYELAGPQDLTTEDMAHIAGGILKREIHAREITLEDWKTSTQLEQKRQEALLAMFRHYAGHGFRGSSWTLSQLLGRHPNSFEDYLRREMGTP
jgi:uncharacterized protein YbjT (DUF2867 family)